MGKLLVGEKKKEHIKSNHTEKKLLLEEQTVLENLSNIYCIGKKGGIDRGC